MNFLEKNLSGEVMKMLGKLIKYEFRSSTRNMLVVWVALLGMSLITGIFLKNDSSIVGFLRIVSGISMFVYASLATIVAVLTIMVIIRRFKNGILGNEGYLMHTLPVTNRKLIVSNGVVAVINICISCIAIMLSVFFVQLITYSGNIKMMLNSLVDSVSRYPIIILIAIELFIITVVSLLINVYEIYLSMAIGQLKNEHRVAYSVASYLGINIVMLILISTVGNFIANSKFANFAVTSASDYSDYVQLNILFLVTFVVMSLVLVVLHIITEKILDKRLNLL